MNIILIGAGGHARSCLDVIENATKKFKVLGFVDKKNSKTDYKLNILGVENDLIKIMSKHKCNNLLIAIGQIKSANTRQNIYKKFKNLGFKFPKIISKNSTVSKKSNILDGTIIMQNVFINSYCDVHENCIINSGSILEHDVTIKNNCHIGPGAIINGGVTIGEGSFIGSGAIVKQNSILPKKSFIQAGTFYSN